MGFNIKNNYGPNIEVNAGGKVTLTQDRSGLWHTVDAEEAEYEEVTTPQVPQQVVPVAKKDYGTPQTDADFKAIFDKEKEEKEALKETAQQEYKTWTNTECFGSPTLEKLEQYRLRILLELFASGIFDSLVSKMVATKKKEGEINFDVLDEEAECRKAWRNYAALRNFFEYETGVLKVGNTSRLGRLFFTLVGAEGSGTSAPTEEDLPRIGLALNGTNCMYY